MEQIDIFDEEFYPIEPKSTTIDIVHQQGLWHQTFACWLINPTDNTIYLQLRGPKNRIGPNTLDASASGHLSAGEQPIDGFRELAEELGGNLNLSNKIYLGINRNIIIQGKYINREFCHVYMAKTITDLGNLQLQNGEVAGILKLDIKQGIQLFSKELQSAEISGLVWNGKEYVFEKRRVTMQDFCSYHDRINISGYYLKVMMTAKSFMKNEPPYRI